MRCETLVYDQKTRVFQPNFVELVSEKKLNELERYILKSRLSKTNKQKLQEQIDLIRQLPTNDTFVDTEDNKDLVYGCIQLINLGRENGPIPNFTQGLFKCTTNHNTWAFDVVDQLCEDAGSLRMLVKLIDGKENYMFSALKFSQKTGQRIANNAEGLTVKSVALDDLFMSESVVAYLPASDSYLYVTPSNSIKSVPLSCATQFFNALWAREYISTNLPMTTYILVPFQTKVGPAIETIEYGSQDRKQKIRMDERISKYHKGYLQHVLDESGATHNKSKTLKRKI